MYSKGRTGGPNFAALGHPLRLRIVEVCTEWGPLSPIEIVNRRLCSDVPNLKGKTEKQQLRLVKYHCDKLEEAELVTLRTEPVRGATKHIYTANAEAFFSDADWAAFDQEKRESLSVVMWQRFVLVVQIAMHERTFDGRKDRMLAWGPLTLDEQGWIELATHFAESFGVVEAIKDRAESRLTAPGASAIRVNYGMFAFESPMAKLGTV